MKTVLYLDCCIRKEQSRTKIIADAFIEELRKNGDFVFETVDLEALDIAPLGKKEYENRERLLSAERFDDPVFDLAKQFARADEIIVAAPFWDMGIPAKLKTYFENVSVSGFTFRCTDEGSFGLCRAERMVYITTRGMEIEDGSVMEQASPYLKALTAFFGIKDFEMVSAYGLDISTVVEIDRRIEKAKQQAVKLVQGIIAREKDIK